MASFYGVFFVLALSFAGVLATNIKVVNRCSVGGNVEFTGNGGIVLQPGQSTSRSVPSGYSGRVSFDPLPSTLAEFSIETNNKNTFDISLVDGFNVGMKVAYTGHGCIRNGSPASNTTVTCQISVDQCPPAYRNGNRCTNPNKDAQTDYSNTVKGICPDAYSWSKDDATSIFTCNTGGDFTVTFCP